MRAGDFATGACTNWCAAPRVQQRAFIACAQTQGTKHILIEPGRPMLNDSIESLNGKFRDECPKEHLFENLHQG
jgi:putative transposase